MVVASLTIGWMVAGCTSPTTQKGPGKYVEQFEFQGKKREYTLIVPKSYTGKEPVPVVIALHGLTASMNNLESLMKIGAKADQEGFIAIIPNGIPESFRGWDTGFFKVAGSPDDADFIIEVLNRTEAELYVDKGREFVFGHSNGAMMAFRMGSLHSNRFAAVAGISGTIGLPSNGKTLLVAPPKQPISALFIHGKKDAVVAYSKGIQAMLVPVGAEEGTAQWAEWCKCTDPTESTAEGLSVRTYLNNEIGVTVKLITCNDGTHEIPGGNYARGAETASRINAMNEVWSFFSSVPTRIK